MPKEYTKEEFWKLYEKLPEELQEAIFSSETTERIYEICKRYEVEKVSEVAKYAGYVLLGVLTPEEFKEILEKELKLDPETTKKVDREIFRFIFFPVKSLLEKIYKIEIAPPAGMPPARPAVRPPAAPPEKVAPPEERPKAPPRRPDIYREAIE